MATSLDFNMKDASSPANTKIVSLAGEIDESNEEELKNLLERLFNDADIKYVVFDLKDLSYMNSRIIGLFLFWFNQFTEDDKNFVLAQAKGSIYDVIEIVGLSSVVDYFPTVEEACLFLEK